MRKLVFSVVMLLSTSAFAFDIDGLKTSMSHDKAIVLLQSYGLSITEKDNNVFATAPHRFYSLNFCKDSLISVQKNLKPTFETFVELVTRFRTLHGNPLEISSETPNPTSSASSHSLTIVWRDKTELISVTHNAFSSNNQTYVLFESRNSCYQHPLLSK